MKLEAGGAMIHVLAYWQPPFQQSCLWGRKSVFMA